MNMTTYDNPHRRTGRHHASGTALIFVVVSLVLMTMIGTAYVNMTRVDHQATSLQLRNNSGNIDANIDTAISQIQGVLRDDLLDAAGNFFNPTPFDPSDNTTIVGGGDETYDYPWTNTNSDWIVTLSSGVVADGTGGRPDPAKGDELDDTWLASTIPDFSLGNPFWPHITNLNGIFLRLPTPGGSELLPEETIVDFDNTVTAPYLNTDTNITINPIPFSAFNAMTSVATSNWQPWGVDADGDGIADSRWTWAPIRRIGDVTYVMAVRIIDNSSLININAATSLTNDGNIGWGANSTRGYYPTDQDLSRLLQRTRVFQQQNNDPPNTLWTNELSNVMNGRGLSTTFPTPLNLSASLGREDGWLTGTAMYGFANDRFTLESELALRFRGGLVHNSNNPFIETSIPTLVRTDTTDPPTESTFQDVDYVTLNLTTNPTDPDKLREELMAYYQGVDPNQAAGSKNNSNVDLRQFPAIRHMLTTFNGSGVHAPNYNDIFGGAFTSKYDLVNEDVAAPATRVTNMANRLNAIFRITDSAAATNAYLGLNTGIPAQSDTLDDIAWDFALAIQDYSDADNIPSAATDPDTGFIHYGLETLPFIREVYVQFVYQDQDLILPIGVPPDSFDTWSRVDNSVAIAIEIANPFDRPISLSVLPVRVNINGNTFELNAGAAQGFTDNTRQLTTRGTPRSTAIIYTNPQVPVLENGFGANLAADLNFNGAANQRILDNAGALSYPLPFNGNNVTVQLQVDVGGGTWVTYDRFPLGAMGLLGQNAQIPHALFITAAANHQHVQASMARDGQGLNFISNTGIGLVTAPVRSDPVPGNLTAFQNASHAFGQNVKGALLGNVPNSFQLPISNRPLLSVAELGWIHMFGFTDQPNGDFPTRFANLAANRRFLDFAAGASVPDSTGIPHAAMVMDQFTTLSPAVDGQDNDGDNRADAADLDQDELLVPGTLNINTAPLHLATLAAPLPEAISNIENLMTAIHAYRDIPPNNDPGTPYDDTVVRPIPAANPNWRQNQGIASMGELMFVNPTANQPNDMQMYGFDGLNGTSQTGFAHDLYPLPEDITNGLATAQIATDSTEESLARFQFLSQAFTTRSDIFTAYVLIQGFPSDDFRQGPVESARFFAIFDRSKINSPNPANAPIDEVRVVSIHRMD